MINKTKIISYLMILIFLLQLSTASAGLLDNNHSIEVKITDAYYGDEDGDGIENDVVIMTEFQLRGNFFNTFEYLIDLVLPSGSYQVAYVLVWSSSTTVMIKNTFWDSATEEGNYSTTVVVQLNGDNSIRDTDSHVFDPPGHDDSPPGRFTATAQ